jgi:hypothetical protein
MADRKKESKIATDNQLTRMQVSELLIGSEITCFENLGCNVVRLSIENRDIAGPLTGRRVIEIEAGRIWLKFTEIKNGK